MEFKWRFIFSKILIPINDLESSGVISINTSNKVRTLDNSNWIKFDIITSNKKLIFSWRVVCKDKIEFKFSSVIFSGLLLNKFNSVLVFKVFWAIGSNFFLIFFWIGPIYSSIIFFSLDLFLSSLFSPSLFPFDFASLFISFSFIVKFFSSFCIFSLFSSFFTFLFSISWILSSFNLSPSFISFLISFFCSVFSFSFFGFLPLFFDSVFCLLFFLSLLLSSPFFSLDSRLSSLFSRFIFLFLDFVIFFLLLFFLFTLSLFSSSSLTSIFSSLSLSL